MMVPGDFALMLKQLAYSDTLSADKGLNTFQRRQQGARPTFMQSMSEGGDDDQRRQGMTTTTTTTATTIIPSVILMTPNNDNHNSDDDRGQRQRRQRSASDLSNFSGNPLISLM